MKHRPQPPVGRDATLTPGAWGGAHIRLEVHEQGATVEYDCAHGSLDAPLMLDADGRFDVRGVYVREGPGPIRLGLKRTSRPARYEGQVKRSQLSLTVTLIDTSQAVGTFTLTRGSEGQLRKCR